MDLIISLIIGGIVGWLASILMKTNAQMGWIANVLIGVVQETRAKRKLDQIALLNRPRARAVRGGLRGIAGASGNLDGMVTSPAACINPMDLEGFNGCIGLPIPSTDCAIMNDAGELLPQGEVGEVRVRDRHPRGLRYFELAALPREPPHVRRQRVPPPPALHAGRRPAGGDRAPGRGAARRAERGRRLAILD